MSHECNNYIIKNGTFIRDFEKMYENIEDPWNQNKNGVDVVFDIFVTLMKSIKIEAESDRKLSVLDVGCANGYHSKRFIKDLNCKKYSGTDISKTIISKAKKENLYNAGTIDVNFIADDIRRFNTKFINEFDIIFSSKTLYYCAPEIDDVLDNCFKYLVEGGFFAFIYNQSEGAFSHQWLTYDLLIDKLLSKGYSMTDTILYDYRTSESTCIGLFQKK